jgi:hypothetical protein
MARAVGHPTASRFILHAADGRRRDQQCAGQGRKQTDAKQQRNEDA